jgi:hypothetical protein
LRRISRLLEYSNAKDPQCTQNFETAYAEITGSVREVFQRIVSELMALQKGHGDPALPRDESAEKN